MGDRPYKLVEYRDRRGEWRWRIKAPNGRTIAQSSESYKRRDKMRKVYYRCGISLTAHWLVRTGEAATLRAQIAFNRAIHLNG